MSGPEVDVALRAPRRLAVAAELARSGALRRAARWGPAAGGYAIAAVLIVWRYNAMTPIALLRAVMLVVLLGIVFLFDDGATRLTEAVPFAWRYQFGLRVLAALGLAAGALAATYGLVGSDATIGLGVALEAAAVLGVGLVVAVAAQRHWGVDEPGVVAGPVMLAFVGMLVLLPTHWPLIVGRGPQWSAAHLRWAAVLFVVVAVLVAASSDPASRRWRGRC